MAFSVEMPALGESVTEGTVTRWLKQEGDTVEVDEPLLEVSTDKVDTEIPSPAAGVLTKIVAQEDDTVEVGGELAVIGDADDDAGSDDADDDAGDSGSADSSGDAADEAPAADPDAPAAGSGDSASGDDEPAETATADTGASSDDGTVVEMPALGESVTEGTVTRWLKAVGDTVEVDEPLLEVSTDKVDTEIPSPVAGTLLSIAAEEDETVEVGGALATIGSSSPSGSGSGSSSSSDGSSSSSDDSADEPPLAQEEKQDEAAREEAASTEKPAAEKPAAEKPAAEPASEQAASPAAKTQAADAESTGSASSGHAPATAAKAADDAAGKHRSGDAAPYVTPLVRKLASENDVDLSALTGTGVGGRIRKQDVLAAAEEAKSAAATPAEPEPAPAASAPAPKAAPAPSPELAALRGTVKKASRIRQITATKTRESLQTTAQLTQVHEVDMTRVVALRARAKKGFAEREGVNLTYLPFFAKAVVEALKAHPNVNASYDEGSKEITYHAAEHLGIAVDTERGLLSPVIHNAGDLSIGGLARAIADIADKARTNKLTPEQLSGGTFTITNIGSQGALIDTPILVPPQSAMLGTGAIVKRPVVVTDELGGDTIAVRSVVYLPLTYDHRLVDGADAGRFLSTIKRRLQEAAFEGDLGL